MATYTDTIGVSGVHGGDLSGGDFATLALWQSTSANAMSNGDVLEAVILNGPPHYFHSTFPPWNSTTDFDIIVRGEDSHEGYWTSADRGTSAGASFTVTANLSWYSFGDQNVNITFRDLIYSGTSTNRSMFFNQFNSTSGYSGQYQRTLTFERCMFTHATNLTGVPNTFFTNYAGFESVDPSTGEVSAIGKNTTNLINCVIEQGSYNPFLYFPTNPRQQCEIEVNLIGVTHQQLTSGTISTVNAGIRMASQLPNSGKDSIFRLNVSGTIWDENLVRQSDFTTSFASATKYVNLFDSTINQSEATVKNTFGESTPTCINPTYTSSNINYNTTYTYDGSAVGGTVSFVEDDENSRERDYRQVEGSLGIDFVSNSTMPSVDVTNTSRGTSPFTLGAYEFISSTTDVTIDFGNTYIRVY